jgi:hypothetical protein
MFMILARNSMSIQNHRDRMTGRLWLAPAMGRPRVARRPFRRRNADKLCNFPPLRGRASTIS